VLNPAVKITKTADKPAYRVGDTVTFTVTVDDIGDTPLGGIIVTDPKTPSCARELPASATFTCTGTVPVPDGVNTATVTASDRLGRQVGATADAKVAMIKPSIAITKDATGPVRTGETVTFTISVKNTGDVPLTAVNIVDDRTPACAKTIGHLAVAAVHTYECTTVAGLHGFTNAATVTGTDPTQRTVTASDDATFTVLHPGIALVMDVRGPFRPGDTVTFTLTVKNTGDTPLSEVTVADAIAPDCARVLGDLVVGGTRAYECTMIAPADDVTNVASVTGKPGVSSVDGAVVDVVH
jgi:uncharacterized repeat protein (TIGR01451 family)